MLFSEYFSITKTKSDTWFDANIDMDTKVFIDPFLIYQTDLPHFKGLHEKIIAFFNEVFVLISKSSGDIKSEYYLKALTLLNFPEVKEICLGYAVTSVTGLGSGPVISKIIAEAIWKSIQLGIKHIDHFEELSIFNENIGPDRISDMVGNIYKQELIRYTQEICSRYNIPTSEKFLLNTSFNFEFLKWNNTKVYLPIHPKKETPIILVPEKFLNPLPVINPDDYWDYVYSKYSSKIGREVSFDLKRSVNKEQIISFARSHPETVKDFIEKQKSYKHNPYDLARDPKLFYLWYKIAYDFVSQTNPTILVAYDEKSFIEKTNEMISYFKNYIELQKGYELLWNDDGTSKSEYAAQRLFLGVVALECRRNNIDVNKEENLGSGPVDFKFSNGYINRILIEFKLARNTKFIQGISEQLPRYLKTESITNGVYILVAFNNEDFKRINSVRDIVNQINREYQVNIAVISIDARPNKKSASKL